LSPGEDFWEKGNALIRSLFKIDPEKLPVERWAKLYNEAIFLKRMEAKTLADVIAAVFGGNQSEQ